MKKPLLLIIFVFSFSRSYAIDFWQYPEMAEKHSLFVGSYFFDFSFTNLFKLQLPEVHLDYMLPFGFPLSLGISVRALDADYQSFGTRASYHINFNDENLDVYIFYSIDIISLNEHKPKYEGNLVYLQFAGRIGFRRRFGQFFCISMETGFMLESFSFGISIKLN
jgi:hypothetical protein